VCSHELYIEIKGYLRINSIDELLAQEGCEIGIMGPNHRQVIWCCLRTITYVSRRERCIVFSMLHLLRAVCKFHGLLLDFGVHRSFGSQCLITHSMLVATTVSDLSETSTFTGCLFHPAISWYIIGIYQQH